MDPLTHALSGAVLGMLNRDRNVLPTADGSARPGDRAVTFTVVAASVLPDIDIVALLWGPFTYFKYHRGPTHSFVGIIFLSAALALIAGRLFRGVSRRRLFLWSLAGTALHVLLDLITSYSTFLLLPFSRRPFFWGLLSFGSRLGWYAFGGAVLSSFLLRKFQAGRAARGEAVPFVFLKPAHFAAAALLLSAGFLGTRAWDRYGLASTVAERYAAAAPERVVLTTGPAGSGEWNFVLKARAEYVVGSVSRGEGRIREAARFRNEADPAAVSAALKSELARAAVGFSPIIHVSSEKSAEGTLVSFADLRYGPSPRVRAEVLLGGEGEILKESYLGFGRRTVR